MDRAPTCKGGSRPRCSNLRPSCGVVLLPIGVANLRLGGAGLGAPSSVWCVLGLTGFALGDGGMARPRRGGGLDPGLPPGIGGRKRGGGVVMSTVLSSLMWRESRELRRSKKMVLRRLPRLGYGQAEVLEKVVGNDNVSQARQRSCKAISRSSKSRGGMPKPVDRRNDQLKVS